LLLTLTLFGLFWLGHACLWMLALNVVYSQPLNRGFLKKYRLVVGLTIWFGPPLFGLLLTWDMFALLRAAWETGAYAVAATYVACCLFVSCVVLPIITIRRLLRRPPAAVLDERTETFDVAKQLGHRPVGDGKYRRLAERSFNQVFRVDFTTLTLKVPDLPAAWNGLTILHLSDLHFIGTPSRDYYRWIIDKCMADGVPDLVCITGDIIDTAQHHRWIIPLLGRLSLTRGFIAVALRAQILGFWSRFGDWNKAPAEALRGRGNPRLGDLGVPGRVPRGFPRARSKTRSPGALLRSPSGLNPSGLEPLRRLE
jgi:uncharacterized protein